MKRTLLVVLVAVLVGITSISYWNYSTWAGLGTTYFYYRGKSEITLDQFNQLQNFYLVKDLKITNLTNTSVLVSYDFTSQEAINFLPEQAEPTFLTKIRTSRITNPSYSLITTLVAVVLMLFVVSRLSKKEENPEAANSQNNLDY